MTTTGRRTLLLLLPLAILGVIVALVVASDKDETTQNTRSPSASLMSGPDDSRSALAIFDREPAVDDALPRRVIRQVTGAAGRQGIDPRGSRLALTNPSGTKVFAVPGRGAVCVASSQSSGQSSVGCGPHAAVAQGYVYDVGWNPEDLRGGKLRRVRIEGLLPNGVSEVRFDLTNGVVQSSAVRGNAYYATLGTWPRRIVFELDGSRRVARIPQLPQRLRKLL